MLDISDWRKDEKKSSGSRQGYWVYGPDGVKYLFKLPKEHSGPSGFVTGEVGAEVLAAYVGKYLGLPVPNVQSATMDGRVGALIRDFVPQGYALREGVDVVGRMPGEIRPTLGEVVAGLSRYLAPHEARSSVIRMVCFDILIANADRHPSNWGIVWHSEGAAVMAPWYDHGSAFGSGLDPLRVGRYLMQGLDRFDRGFRYEIAVSPRRGRAKLRELLEALLAMDGSLAGFQDLVGRLTDSVIRALVESVVDREHIMTPERWRLAVEILRRRRDGILGGAGGGFDGAA